MEKLLELRNEISKAAGYKINLKNPLYRNINWCSHYEKEYADSSKN